QSRKRRGSPVHPARFLVPWASWKKHQDEFHQNDVGQNDEERRKDDGTCRRKPDARGATLGAHSLKAADRPDDKAEDSGPEGRGKKVVEVRADKTLSDESVKGNGLDQGLRDP